MKLPIGKARYGVMLREDGIVFDDGTTTRISESHFHMTTTTAQAVNVLAHLEYYLQVVWPELDVNVLSTTEQWAGAALAGPNSRNLLRNFFQRSTFQTKQYHSWDIKKPICMVFQQEFSEFPFQEN